MLGMFREEGVRGCDGGITYALDVNLGKLGDGEGPGGLACCSPWARKEPVGHDWETEQSLEALPVQNPL